MERTFVARRRSALSQRAVAARRCSAPPPQTTQTPTSAPAAEDQIQTSARYAHSRLMSSRLMAVGSSRSRLVALS